MAILGIPNRTENWKTARHFAPLPQHSIAELARQLLPERDRESLRAEDVQLELFWRGMRDYFHDEQKVLKKEERRLADIYRELFPSLREEVEAFGGFQKLKPWNYDVSGAKGPRRLANNLRNTEIDIVLASSNHLFIGEAKDQSQFRGNSKLALPHQLIRHT
ncbi:MAG: hypothetical protein OXI51_00685 [Chloroflexota bacterium]|nr:hypothetical protein [Chloroflexota bacterium]